MLQVEFRDEIANVSRAEVIRRGFEVAIVGPPNAGKSTLLNKLSGREAAITSEIAGTTRDVIEVRMDLSGLAVTFLDTAGLRETDDPLEAIGIDRARQRAVDADLRVFLGNAGLGIDQRPGDVIVAPKSDLGGQGAGLPVSGMTGEGVGQLLSEIESVLRERVAGSGTATRQRHAAALSRALESLDRAESAIGCGNMIEELVAEDLRAGVRSVDGLVGRIGVEDILGEIFGSFCIGK